MIQFRSIRGLSMVWLALSFARSHAAALGENDDAVRQTSIERTAVASYFPFDAGIDGNEAAIAERARHGFAGFNGKAARARCHTGWNFTDDRFREVGASSIDIGRGALEPDNVFAQYAFRSSTLRDRAWRAPSKLLKRIDFNKQKVADAIEFRKSLTGSKQIVVLPVLPN